MDSKASILSRDRILAPNTFTVSLSVPDFKRMAALGDSLIEELTELATKHAKKQGFQFGAALAIKLIEDSTLNLGQVSVRSNTQNHEIEWMATLEVNGQRFMLKVGQTSIGRDVTADIQIQDNGLSRVHFAIFGTVEMPPPRTSRAPMALESMAAQSAKLPFQTTLKFRPAAIPLYTK
jgi:hypothetical protein